MNNSIVSIPHAITLIGGVKPAQQDLSDALRWGETVVCADGGADHALESGLRPAAVIGDMDSVGTVARKAFADVMHPIAEQDSTDFDKALRHVVAPLVLGVGFSGARLDHELGSMSVLVRHADRRCILIGAETIVTVCPPEITLDLAEGAAVSLFPMAEVRCDSEGLNWPTDGLCFAPDGQIGTLNKATGRVRLRPDAPKLLLILPRSALDLMVRAVLAADAQWPSRAR